MKWRPLLISFGVLLLLSSVLAVPGLLGRLRAERLWSHVQTLRVGESTFEQVREFTQSHGGREVDFDNPLASGPATCTADRCRFMVRIDHWHANRIAYADECSAFQRLILRPLNSFGLRPWRVATLLEVNHGRLTQVLSAVEIRRQDGFWIFGGTEMRMTIPEYYEAGSSSYFVRWAHVTITGNGEALSAIVTPQVTEEELRHAFDINWNCLTEIGGCRHLNDLMPSAWNDFLRYASQKGWDQLPYSTEPNCQ